MEVEKWVPPILVFFQWKWFFTSMIIGERVREIHFFLGFSQEYQEEDMKYQEPNFCFCLGRRRRYISHLWWSTKNLCAVTIYKWNSKSHENSDIVCMNTLDLTRRHFGSFIAQIFVRQQSHTRYSIQVTWWLLPTHQVFHQRLSIPMM